MKGTATVHWKKLRHHEGAAVDVPEWVSKLAGGNAKRSYLDLESAFVNPGEQCSAAAPTLALLMENLEPAKNPSWVLRIAAQIVGNDQLNGWLRQPNDIPQEFSTVLEAHGASLEWALSHTDEKVRAAAGFLLGTAPAGTISLFGEKVLAQIANENSVFALASLLLAFGRMTGALPASLYERLSSHPTPLARGALAVSALRSGKSITDVVAGLEGWFAAQTLEDRDPPSFWWWWKSLRLQRRTVALENFLQGPVLLAELSQRRHLIKEWSEPIIEAAQGWESGRARRSVTEFLIHAWELGAEPDGIFKPDEQSEDLQWLFRKISSSRLFAHAGYGIPTCGKVRERWLGENEPTIMESRISTETSGKEPLYWLCKTHETYFREKAAQALGLSGFERWQFYASRACGEYGPATPPPSELLEQLIADAATDPRIQNIGRIYADEVGARIAEWDDQEIRHRFGPANSALVVLPLVMAGVPWDERWESALAFDEDEPELGRRLFEAVPLVRRDAYLTQNPPALAYQLAFMDLWSGPEQVRVALETIQEFLADGEELSEAELELERRIYSLAEESSIFAVGVAEFKKSRAES